MESALERLRRSRAEQDSGCFVAIETSIPEPILKKNEITEPLSEPILKKNKITGPCYSLSDA